MHEIYCDRCGARAEQNGKFPLVQIVVAETISEACPRTVDLCLECRKQLTAWIDTKKGR